MRNLLLNSILCLILMGCSKAVSPVHFQKVLPDAKVCIADLKPKFTSVLYNTKVDVVGKHLSGLLLFKQMPDSSTRVVFSSEMGVNFFDFEYSSNGFKVHSCMEQLNRKIVIRQLKKDIGLLFMYNCHLADVQTFNTEEEMNFAFVNGSEEDYYISDLQCSNIKRIENVVDNHKKVIVNVYGSKGQMPDSVMLSHQNFEFMISLKQIVR